MTKKREIYFRLLSRGYDKRRKNFSTSYCNITAQENCAESRIFFSFFFLLLHTLYRHQSSKIIDIFSVHYTSIYTSFSLEICVILCDATWLSSVTIIVPSKRSGAPLLSGVRKREKIVIESERRMSLAANIHYV